jgi:small redox-active disulfide protein 2
MEIKILGTGCAKCQQLYDGTQKAVQELGLAAHLTKVDKINDIMAYRVLMTPALVINEEVKVAGRHPSAAELATWLTTAAAKEASR